METLEGAERAMSCFILCFLWVCILPCHSLTGSLLSFRGIGWKRVCVFRDNVGRVQGLLIEFLLTFYIYSASQPEQGWVAQQPPPSPSAPFLLGWQHSRLFQSCFPTQTVTPIRNWCDSKTGERQICGLWGYLEIGFASTVQSKKGIVKPLPEMESARVPTLYSSTQILLVVWDWLRESRMWCLVIKFFKAYELLPCGVAHSTLPSLIQLSCELWGNERSYHGPTL